MQNTTSRHIENDIPAGRERLSAEEARAIQAECALELDRGVRRIVESSPPVVPRGRIRMTRGSPTLYYGLLGQAFGFLHLYERSGKPGELALAHRYLEAARGALERSSLPPATEWLSFHAAASLPAVAAVIHDRMGDVAVARRFLDDYRALASTAADPDYESEDLLWGRGGFLFGAAFLRARLGEASIDEALIEPALDAMLATGRRHAAEQAHELTEGPHGRTPLLYMNFNSQLIRWFARGIIGSRNPLAQGLAGLGARVATAVGNFRFDVPHRYDLSLVHGVPGNLYLMMHFPELLARHADWERDIRQSLDCLTDYVDAERGMLELLPSPRSDASQRRRGCGPYTDRVHWCAGTPGMVFVFSRAFQVFGDLRYREAAERAADHVWKNGLLRKGNGICHGIAGNGYAFLALHRATGDPLALDRALHFARQMSAPRVVQAQRTPDRPDSLYEGAMGTLCFHADCQDPLKARFPAFEV